MAKQPTATGSFPMPQGYEAFVYRAYCQCGDLLYVGLTNDLTLRLAGHHRDRSPWLTKAIRIDWEVYPTRADAARAERRQIRTLHPLFNTQDAVPRPPKTTPLPWPRAFTEAELDQRAIATYRGVSYLEWLWSDFDARSAA